jgi:hypothetical protein
MFIQEGIRTGQNVPKQEMERLSILSDTGECLFHISLTKDGILEVEGSTICKHNGVVLLEGLIISPHDNHRIFIQRIPYEG